MSKKRAADTLETRAKIDDIDIQDPDFQDIEKITSQRKLKKLHPDDTIGFCDCCNRLTTIKCSDMTAAGVGGVYVYLCIDCEIADLAFSADFLEIGNTPAAPSSPPKDAGNEPTPTCWGCRENQPNQLAHMDYGGCLREAGGEP